MRKWAEEREHHSKSQENLTSELVQKDAKLQKWREERDNLVKELEVQLKNLMASNIQKDKEIERLKASSQRSQEEFIHDQSEIVLDSSEVSTENGERTSRFPKPELEIQFTPLRPNKMSVKEQGCDSSITVKCPRYNRKRKSTEMDQRAMHSRCWKSNSRKRSTASGICKDNEDSENKKNVMKSRIANNISPTFPMPSVNSPAKENTKGPTVQLGRQTSASSLRSPRKKDGTLQKIGDFLQKSPTALQFKAKKFMGTLSSPKNPEVEIAYNNETKPKRSRRKLYKKDISSPMDIACQPIMELNEKESDHAIMKRRLRARTTKATK
uniref:Uncharacterized protein n=1 Tax=Callorhinchus milii TaxID=7868 RepID=A0A4W3KG56_CALMI